MLKYITNVSTCFNVNFNVLITFIVHLVGVIEKWINQNARHNCENQEKLIQFFWFSERQNKYFSKYMTQAKLFLFFLCSRSRHPFLNYHLNLIRSLKCYFRRIPFKCTTPTQSFFQTQFKNSKASQSRSHSATKQK
jgi:hypothetical protein